MITLELSPRINPNDIVVVCDNKKIDATVIDNVIKINVLDNKEHTIQLIEVYKQSSRRVVAVDGDYFYVVKQFAWWYAPSWILLFFLIHLVILFLQQMTLFRAVSIFIYGAVCYFWCFRLNIIKYKVQRRLE